MNFETFKDEMKHNKLTLEYSWLSETNFRYIG